MADEVESQSESGTSRGGKSRLLPILIVVLIMGMEGAGVYFLTKSISGSPADALGQPGAAATGQGAPWTDVEPAEVALAECRPSNSQLGKLVTYHIRVTALVDPARRKEMEEMVEAKQARIEDRISVVIRSAEPKHLSEPGLETVRRRLKRELGEVLGDDQLIQTVLIPHILQSGP